MKPEEVQRIAAIFQLMTDKETRAFLWHLRRNSRTFLHDLAESLGVENIPRSQFQLVNVLQKFFADLRKPKEEKEPDPTFECVGCGDLTTAKGLRWKKLGEGKPVTVSHDRSNMPRSLANLTDEEIYRKSFKPWETKVVKFKFLKTGKGDCHITWKQVDGRGGTLEYVWQPSGNAEFMEQGGDLSGDMVMDFSERWTPTSATEVVKHGAGHVLGFGHTASRKDVMYAYADNKVKLLSKNDKEQRDERYPIGKAA